MKRSLAILTTGVLALGLSPTAATAQATWTLVPSPNLSQNDNTLMGADAISASQVWAVGRATAATAPFQRALTMRWNGSAWSTVASPNPGTDNRLDDVDGNSASNVWAVGSHIQRWNGSAWNVVAAPAGSYRGVKTFSTNEAWAVGTTGFVNSATLTARWNGTSWSAVPSPTRAGAFNELRAVDGVAPNDVWAVGSTNVDPNYGVDEALILHWNGSSWTSVPAPDQFAALHGVVALSSNDVWAVGEEFSRSLVRFVPYAIHWDGTSWRRTSVPSSGGGSGGRFNAVTALSPTQVYAVGDNDANPLAMRWNGTGWSVEALPAVTPFAALNGATSIGADTVWSVGTQAGDLAQRTLTVRTTNG